MISDERVNRLLALALSPPPAGRVRWATRLLAKEIAITSGCASDILRRYDLKPHRLRTYKVSQGPRLAAKLRDAVGLYLNPPEHAVVLSVDEKTQIQALERTQPPLPLRSGPAVRHTHDYKRHGIVDLYAALEVATGHVTHQLTDSHTAADFLGFMRRVVRAYPERELHVVVDNSSTHSTPDVKTWLEAHPRVHFHYTPTSASWLNQVEGFFGILGKQSLAVSNHVSKKALREHIEAFLRSWNRNPTPFVWTKSARAIVRSHTRMLERISTAVHWEHQDGQWRHPETMQLDTRIHAALPRVECPDQGVWLVNVPSAGTGSRPIVLFAGETIDWLGEESVAAEIRRLRLSWVQCWTVMRGAVARGLERRKELHALEVGNDFSSTPTSKKVSGWRHYRSR